MEQQSVSFANNVTQLIKKTRHANCIDVMLQFFPLCYMYQVDFHLAKHLCYQSLDDAKTYYYEQRNTLRPQDKDKWG